MSDGSTVGDSQRRFRSLRRECAGLRTPQWRPRWSAKRRPARPGGSKQKKWCAWARNSRGADCRLRRVGEMLVPSGVLLSITEKTGLLRDSSQLLTCTFDHIECCRIIEIAFARSTRFFVDGTHAFKG